MLLGGVGFLEQRGVALSLLETVPRAAESISAAGSGWCGGGGFGNTHICVPLPLRSPPSRLPCSHRAFPTSSCVIAFLRELIMYTDIKKHGVRRGHLLGSFIVLYICFYMVQGGESEEPNSHNPLPSEMA